MEKLLSSNTADKNQDEKDSEANKDALVPKDMEYPAKPASETCHETITLNESKNEEVLQDDASTDISMNTNDIEIKISEPVTDSVLSVIPVVKKTETTDANLKEEDNMVVEDNDLGKEENIPFEDDGQKEGEEEILPQMNTDDTDIEAGGFLRKAVDGLPVDLIEPIQGEPMQSNNDELLSQTNPEEEGESLEVTEGNQGI